MSHHHHEDDCCCAYPMMGMGGYGMGGYGGGYGYQGSYVAGGGAAWGIRWIYALLILIVIVLTFGRREFPFVPTQTNVCDGDGTTAVGGFGGLGGFPFNFESIDRSVLFIIVVFLLILCAGCFWGGYGAGGCGSF